MSRDGTRNSGFHGDEQSKETVEQVGIEAVGEGIRNVAGCLMPTVLDARNVAGCPKKCA